MLPDRALFLYFYVRKEAVLSSQIEGTQSSLSDLLQFESTEAAGVPLEDVEEVSQYVAATNRAVELLREGLPLSSRFIRDVHEVLLSSGRGASKQPGAFRRQPVWLGGSSPTTALFVPPPWDEVAPCVAELETFLHSPETPTLIKAALAHAQFETIHPFLDGNGRLGRLLIPLVLMSEGALSEPLLYLSLFFKKHRRQYYERLQATRDEGEWEGWLGFFLEGVEQTAETAHATARRALELFTQHEAQVNGLGGAARLSVLEVLRQLRHHPVSTAQGLAATTKLSAPTTTKALGQLERLGLVRELSGKERRRVFAYAPLIALLQDDLA
jgi:Fic family protein